VTVKTCLSVTGNVVIKAGLKKNASQEPTQTRKKPEKPVFEPIFSGLWHSTKVWANPRW
jgi:hypothetical protein